MLPYDTTTSKRARKRLYGLLAFWIFFIAFIALTIFVPRRVNAQCTNPTGAVNVGFGSSICYDANTTISSLTVIFDGQVTIADGVTLTVTGATMFAGTGSITLGDCSSLILQGSFSGSVVNGIQYNGSGACDAVFRHEAAATLSASLTTSSNIRYCNLNGSPTTGSPGAATNTCASPLPVDLLSFIGTNDNGSVTLNWITSSETNNSHFVIESSINGNDWEYVGEVQGQGTTRSPSEYTFTDPRMIRTTMYYRLVQFDYNGDSEIHRTIVVNADEQFANIYAYPNPAESTISIHTEGNEDLLSISISDVNGKVIITQKGNPGRIDVSNLSSGIYIIRYFTASTILSEKLNIQ